MSANTDSFQLKPGTEYRFEQEVWFDNHLFGTDEQYPNAGECEIRRGNDGQYWNGATWQAGQVWNTTTVDGGGLFHYYDFTLPTNLGYGATLTVKIRVTDDEFTEHTCNATMDLSGLFQAGPWRHAL